MMKKELIIKETNNEVYEFINEVININANDIEVLKTINQFNIDRLGNKVKAIVNIHKLNDIARLNEFFISVNKKLEKNRYFVGVVETQTQRKNRLLKKYPPVIAQLYILSDFIFKRVFPKLKATRWLYIFITAGRNKIISKAETLGRLVFCGFEIIETREINNLTWFIVKKTEDFEPKPTPSYGLLFKMQRVGKHGKPITVYKFRTMHPYAEYLQDYMYRTYNLQKGGKFKNDFRITPWGKIMRKLWIDEIPMIYNVLKGELKLVGVRPLSKHYLSLYDEQVKVSRLQVKPGMVPPFYADLPETLEEIMQSELKYIEQYKQNPLETDTKYFVKALRNILLKKARSN
jgi:lipopolysaccharide/colanic/teichoic acid biosynthesis glycosyltransferase